MRNLKFRAKCSKTGKWVYGYYAKYNFVDGTIRHGILEADKPVSLILIDLNTLGQLVTIQDGQEIYEGDLVEEHYIDEGKEHTSLFPIVWSELKMSWSVLIGSNNQRIYVASINNWFNTEKMKINGNIHDQKTTP